MNRPTMETVAERAGVSRALVSLVMNDSPKVSDERRAAVLRAAKDLGYRRNLHARNLAQQRTQTFGILINDIHNPFFAEVVAGVEKAAADHDYDVIILNGGRDPERERRAIETYLQFRVEALVLIGPRLSDAELRHAARDVPTVVVAAGGNFPSTDTITTDDIAGTRLAVEHLVGLGHRDIVHLDGGNNISADVRRQGFVEAMNRCGLDGRIITGGDSGEQAAPAIKELLASKPRPTAILAFNDLLAAGVLSALSDTGVDVPGDISVVSIDNTFIAALGHLSLTAVNQPRWEMGAMAVATVLDRIGDQTSTDEEPGGTPPVASATHQSLAPNLVVRKSSAPPRTGAQ